MDATMVPQNIQDRNVKNYPVSFITSITSPSVKSGIGTCTMMQQEKTGS